MCLVTASKLGLGEIKTDPLLPKPSTKLATPEQHRDGSGRAWEHSHSSAAALCIPGVSTASASHWTLLPESQNREMGTFTMWRKKKSP